MSSGVRILMIGAGGHARVCLEALQDEGHLVVGAVSNDGTGVEGLGVPVLGTPTDLGALADAHDARSVCVAVGDNAARARIAAEVESMGFSLATAQSAHAIVSRTATVGPGSHLLPGAVINAATSIGTATIVNTNASIDHDCTIGDFVHVAPGVAMGGAVEVGARTFVGIGSRVLPGVSLGRDVVVGGGAVVIDDVPDGTTVVGVPARPLER